MKRNLIITSVTLLALGLSTLAHAVTGPLTVSSSVGGIPSFPSPTILTLNGPTPPVLTLNAGSFLTTGANFAVAYVPPYYSGATPGYFGETPANGLDASQYLVVLGGGSATFNLGAPVQYFGVLIGSVDPGNLLSFYDGGNNLIGTVVGTDIPASASPGTGPNSTEYLNVFSPVAFSKVIATTPNNSFEMDDVTYAVPEPTSVTMLVAGLAGLIFSARRKSA